MCKIQKEFYTKNTATASSARNFCVKSMDLTQPIQEITCYGCQPQDYKQVHTSAESQAKSGSADQPAFPILARTANNRPANRQQESNDRQRYTAPDTLYPGLLLNTPVNSSKNKHQQWR